MAYKIAYELSRTLKKKKMKGIKKNNRLCFFFSNIDIRCCPKKENFGRLIFFLLFFANSSPPLKKIAGRRPCAIRE
jgi:hypothetical protein